jgi:hypothetical protein
VHDGNGGDEERHVPESPPTGREAHRPRTHAHAYSDGLGIAHSIPSQRGPSNLPGMHVSGSVTPQHMVEAQSVSAAQPPPRSLAVGAVRPRDDGSGLDRGTGASAGVSLAAAGGGADEMRVFGESQPNGIGPSPSTARLKAKTCALTPARDGAIVRGGRRVE